MTLGERIGVRGEADVGPVLDGRERPDGGPVEVKILEDLSDRCEPSRGIVPAH
jgi:hypothetical protein